MSAVESDESLPYLQILDTAPDAMVVVDRSGRIVFVNEQTEKLFGRRRAELRGQMLECLIPPRFHAGHGHHIERYFAHPATRPMGSGLALLGLRADGVEFPIEVSLSPVLTKDRVLVSAAIRDVTERKRMEAATRTLAERLSSAVESIQDAFALFDDHDRLVLCNSEYRLLVRDPSGPVVGKPYEALLDAWIGDIAFADEAERSRFREERLERRHNEQTTSFDVRMKDGRNLRVIDRRMPDGGTVKTIWDLTQDAQREEELRTARAAADAANAAKSEFLASMSHELRTPLNAILGFAQMQLRDRREPIPQRHGERAQRIIKGGEHLLRLIDDILDLSRIEAGGISISTEPVNVASVLDELRTTLEESAARESVKLEFKPLPAQMPLVSVDRTRFAQILMNFGSNAIKYNRKDGSVSFTVSSPDGTHVRIAVADTGTGIPIDKQDKIFQPFQRAGQETGPIEGTGIGLVITKRLAELMRGRVGFSSKPGVGSEFWVDVPVHHAATLLTVPAISEAPLRSRAGAGKHTVLYVEDNPENVVFMRDVFDLFDDLELLVEPTAEAGIERAREVRPNAIIMDINLPGMSGVAALKALQSFDETRGIPVIALTAAASIQNRRVGLDAGFFRYLTKPVKVAELEDALFAVLENAKHAGS